MLANGRFGGAVRVGLPLGRLFRQGQHDRAVYLFDRVRRRGQQLVFANEVHVVRPEGVEPEEALTDPRP